MKLLACALGIAVTCGFFPADANVLKPTRPPVPQFSDKPSKPSFGEPAGKRSDKRNVITDFFKNQNPCKNPWETAVLSRRRLLDTSAGSLLWNPCSSDFPSNIAIATRSDDKRSVITDFFKNQDPCKNPWETAVLSRRRLLDTSSGSLLWNPCSSDFPSDFPIITRSEDKRSIISGFAPNLDPCKNGLGPGVLTRKHRQDGLPPGVLTRRRLLDTSIGSLWWDPSDPCNNKFPSDIFITTRSEDKRDSISGFAPFDPCNNGLGPGVLTRRRLLDTPTGSLWWDPSSDPCNKNNPFEVIATREDN